MDVTEECIAGFTRSSYYLSIDSPDGFPILSFGSKLPHVESFGRERGYRVEFDDSLSLYGGFRVFKKN